ncbi:hypothetical protein LTR72_005124 [Exophiala xenobiotica]|nr:hypothetical protein LTR92_001293 [Exophiala xenobiotica]KAK5223738.1 hypothetical protein LTR72_005124 [Exophiala xenobiotica]KAK5289139.1 hypothetical protein LTR14_007390 [Exophiala xenobiotica]KAK5500033.1 hypothetical protein LTR55_000856 [Exophiala xenobiotica]KAK5560192.1 hypothetical protein LTR46_001942 [Exophiala xenobiotica]
MISRRPLRVGNVSGATGDMPTAMARMVAEPNIDIITGDWLSEMNIAWNAITKSSNPDLGYEEGFFTQLSENLDTIIERGMKVITNAGALNTASLTAKVRDLCASRGYHNTIVAAVLGDDISHLLRDPTRRNSLNLSFPHLDHTDRSLGDWDLTPFCGNAYIGCRGIVEALNAGAQIVICGRVTDASPVMGAAAWHFGWPLDSPSHFDHLAGSLLAGHLIECGSYIVGANFSGFKDFLPELVDVAFPIAEIDAEGRCVITKTTTGGGHVTPETVKAQALYELQGHLYLNPDVVADLSQIRIEAEPGTVDRVRVSGVKGFPPPPSTKAMFAAPGGYQAEATFFINGLDVDAKATMMRNQLKHIFRDHKFTKLSIEQYGSEVKNPDSQQAGTVQLRVFAQARRKEDIDAQHFKIPIYALRMQSYPGYHMNLDFRTMDPKPFMEIFPATIPLSAIELSVDIGSGKVMDIPSPTRTAEYPSQRPSYETSDPIDLASLGPTTIAPLGSIVHARSGDKADNSNIGFFVRHEDEYQWLKTLFTVERLKSLFGRDWLKADPDRRVERVEFPNILAVHFRVLDNLSGGIASSDRIDGLGKGIGEYLRSRHVEIPTKFLERGWI